MANLFDPLRIGRSTLRNRVLLAPLTRSRAQANGVHTPLAIDYYSQRASAGLLITEAIAISKQGSGYPNIPGLWNGDQIDSWRPIISAVHAKGARIFAQIFHTGRIGHSSLFGGQPVSASAIAPEGQVMAADYRMVDFETPRALSSTEIASVVAEFAMAARNAIEAGFDGVELHGANGYLIDQFLRDGSNKRTDSYGGSSANRARFLREVVAAVADAIGADRVGVRLSPHNAYNSMADSNPSDTFLTAARDLEERHIAYLHVIEPVSIADEAKTTLLPGLRAAFKNPIILNSGYSKADADRYIGYGLADAVAFGQAFLANPDLPLRLELDAPLNEADPATFYGGGEAGYTDYPRLRLDIAS